MSSQSSLSDGVSTNVDTPEQNVLDPHYLISLFVTDDATESDAVSLESVMKVVQAAPMSKLLDGNTFAALQTEHLLGSYLSAMLCAFSTLPVTRIRLMIYSSAIAKLRDGKFSDAELEVTQTHLLQYAHQLSDGECFTLVGKIFDTKDPTRWTVDKTVHVQVSGLTAVLELASRLCERPESQVRHACHAAIMNVNGGHWPPSVTLMLAAAATEMSSTAAECAETLSRISAGVKWSAAWGGRRELRRPRRAARAALPRRRPAAQTWRRGAAQQRR